MEVDACPIWRPLPWSSQLIERKERESCLGSRPPLTALIPNPLMPGIPAKRAHHLNWANLSGSAKAAGTWEYPSNWVTVAPHL